MAKNPWALSPDTAEKVRDLASALQEDKDILEEDFEGKSEKWREGEKGVDVEGWIAELDELIGTLEALDVEK